MPPIFFITSAIWRCIFRSRFSSCTSRPAPAAMRRLRLACRRSGLRRSRLVIELISAICRRSMRVVEARLVHLLLHLGHAGHHAHHALHAAHLLHLLQLRLQVVHVELALLEALHHALGRLGLQRLLRLLDQRHDVAHAEDAAGDALGVELLERVELLAEADEADRLAGDGAHRERRAAAAVAVHAGQDHAGDADAAVELLGDVHRVLAGQPVDHQQRLVRLGRVAHRLDLGHQRVVDVQPPGGVEHHHVVAAEGRLLAARAWRSPPGPGPARSAGRRRRPGAPRMASCSIAAGRRVSSEAISTRLPSRSPEAARELGGGGGLARALQPDHQDRRGRRVDAQRRRRPLAAPARRTSSSCTILTTCWPGVTDFVTAWPRAFSCDRLHEVARHRQRDVGLEQRHAHLAQRGGDVLVAQRALAGQLVEDAGEPAAEVLEHGAPSRTPIAPVGATR